MIRHRLCRAQYSLATMLLVVTALCVWLSVQVNRAHRQRAAVAAIKNLGGLVGYDESALPIWLQQLGGDAFVHVVDVNFYKCPVTDQDLACLVGLPYVRYLTLGDTAIGDGAIQQFVRLPLRKLYLSDTKLTDTGAKQLENLRDLELVELFRTDVTEAGIIKLRLALPACEIGWWKSGG